MDERRKFERFAITVPAKIEIPHREGLGKILDLETSSLSAGGMFLKYGKMLPIGSQVKIEVVLHFEELKTLADPPGTLIITATGSVLRSGPEGMAIGFNEDYDIIPGLNHMQKGD